MLPNLNKWLKKRKRRMARKLGLNKPPHRQEAHRRLTAGAG